MPWITLDRFTEKPILRAGLEVRCPHCSQRNWFDTKTLDYTLLCNRCLKEFPFPQTAASLKRLPWALSRYRPIRDATLRARCVLRGAGSASIWSRNIDVR
jgi:hypothetical protein